MALAIGDFGRLLTIKRGSRGVRAASADAGVSTATFSRVENGHMPDLQTFAKLCKWLGRDPREFLGIETDDGAQATPDLSSISERRRLSKWKLRLHLGS